MSLTDEEIDQLTDQLTSRQYGYIIGLCKNLRYDPNNLPIEISPIPSWAELTEGQAIRVIDKLISLGGRSSKALDARMNA